jgi:hypothetical protein
MSDRPTQTQTDTPDSQMEYLDEFDNLEYEIVDEHNIELTNLKAMGGMEVAELLTYMNDDGFMRCGNMSAKADNGFLRMVHIEEIVDVDKLSGSGE